MTSEYNIVWIDDDEERREQKRGGVGTDNRINLITLGPMEAASELLGGTNGEGKIPSELDLALVDWYLHTDEFSGDGPSIEGILRDTHKTTPVYAFSGEYGNAEFEREQKRGEHRFALITSPDRLDDEDLIQDIQDYQQIRTKEGEDIDGILELLGASADLTEKIRSTLPQEFAEGLPAEGEGDSDSSLRFARWVRHELLETPGLLWDDVWTATKVGIKKQQFTEYSSELSNAKYDGVFSHRNNLWWRLKVRDRIYQLADEKDHSIDRLWKSGPELLDVSESDRSTCEVDSCDKSHPPQTVAAGSPSKKSKFQVHYNCSNIEQSGAATFEDLRVLVEL